MGNIKFTSPTNILTENNFYLQFGTDGLLVLKGYIFPRINKNVDIQCGWHEELPWDLYGPPQNALKIISPNATPGPYPPKSNLIWFLDGSIYTMGDLFTNYYQTFPLNCLILKDINSNPIAAFDTSGNFYLKSAFSNIGTPLPPIFEPNKWNDGGDIQRYNNCYNYANNQITYTWARPGLASCSDHIRDKYLTGRPYTAYDANELIGACEDDGLEYKGKTLPHDPTDGRHIICLFCNNLDFHFLRKDGNSGNWSHKMGNSEVTDKDDSHNTITDPERCNILGYNFVGYFYTRGNNAFIR